jgi:hypothetical protein
MNSWKRVGMVTAVVTTVAGSSVLFAQDRRAPFPEQQPPGAPQAPAEKIEPPADRPPRAQAPMPRPPDASGSPPSGVIRPPETGDRGVLSPPNQDRSSTPELRPPGTPGGNPGVQPR